MQRRPVSNKPKPTQKPVKDLRDFAVVERFGKKKLTGADPVLLGLIKKAVEEGNK